MNPRIKIAAAALVLAAALGVVAYQLGTRETIRGAKEPYTAWCAKCDKDFPLTKEEVVRKGVPDVELGGWRITCSTCGAMAYVRRAAETMPKDLIRKSQAPAK